MLVVSNEYGFCLIFENKEDLKTVINHLQGQLENIEMNKVKPPHLYMTFDTDSKGKEKGKKVQDFMHNLKKFKVG